MIFFFYIYWFCSNPKINQRIENCVQKLQTLFHLNIYDTFEKPFPKVKALGIYV